MLANINKLAVHTENAMVARDILSKMRQDRYEPVRAYSARLKGKARVCQFTARCQCSNYHNHDACVGVDYSDIVVRDQVILGCADHEIKLDCLIAKGPSASLEEVIAFVESTESGKLSLQQLNCSCSGQFVSKTAEGNVQAANSTHTPAYTDVHSLRPGRPW